MLAHATATLTTLDVSNAVLEAVHLGGNPILADAEAGVPPTVRFGVPLDRRTEPDEHEEALAARGDSEDEQREDERVVRV